VLSAAPPEGIPVRDIITATGMSRRWVFYRLQQMAAEGLAAQVARGYWRAAQ
jgi:DNA-binding IclR family transcriptional regulator